MTSEALSPVERLRAQRDLLYDTRAALARCLEQADHPPYPAHRAPVLDAAASVSAALMFVTNDLYREQARQRVPDLRLRCSTGELALYPTTDYGATPPTTWEVVLNSGGPIGTVAAEHGWYRGAVNGQVSLTLLQDRRTAALWVHSIWITQGAENV